MMKKYFSYLGILVSGLAFTGMLHAQTTVTITEPSAIAGDYEGIHAAFGPYLGGQSASVVLIDDGAGATTGCVAAANDLSGAIALIDRGVCGFTTKVATAEAAGAIAVIVCNNDVANPDAAIIMGNGATDPLACAVTIPAVMVSYNTCQTIKAELANGAVSATLPDEDPTEEGQSITNPIALAGPGTYTATELTGSFALLTDGTAAKFYTITAPSTGVMNVNSCLGGVDTRVAVLQGCRNALTLIDLNDDACELTPGGDAYASSLDVIVTEGESYVIYWDDIWDSTGFDFTIAFGALPSVDVTFHVDMQDETVAPDGVKVSINGTEYDMVDDNDGTWSYTGSFTAADILEYRFANGAGNLEDNADLAGCRTVAVGLNALSTNLVCYNSCSACPPDVACPNWIQDDFEEYALGDISPQSDDWATWSGAAGENSVVSADQANSGAQSLHVTAAGGDDQLLLLGDRTSGHYVLSWKMFIPTGSGAYYNLQKDQDTPGVGDAFANEVVFQPGGTASYFVGGGSVDFSYPHDTWFTVYHDVDLDNNSNRLLVDGQLVTTHPANWQAGSQTGIAQLGSVDFFGWSNVSADFFVDDVLLKEIEACPANAIICDGFDAYDLGAPGPQAPWWDTWTFNPGGPDDGAVVNEAQFSCEQSLKISNADGDDVLLLLGDRTSGNYLLSWKMFVPAGFGAYYNTQKFQDNPGASNGFGMQIDFLADGTGTLDAGGADAASFTYPHDVWFDVVHHIDVDNDVMSLRIDGVDVYTWQVSDRATVTTMGIKQIGAVDLYGNTGNLYYVDDVLFQELPAAPGNACFGAIDLNDYLGAGLGSTTATPLFDNTNNSTTAFDPGTGWECFGEPDGAGAAPELNNTMWFTFVGDGETYYIETGACGAANYIEDGDTQMAIYSGNCGSLSPVACNEDSPNAVAGNYISGLELATTAGTTYYLMIDGFNLFNGQQISAGEFCLNFTQLTGTVPSVSVTFQVDMTDYIAAGGTLETVKIAGNFTDNGASVPNWTPPASPVFTDLGDDVWSATIEFPLSSAGQSLEYKFLNTADSWGDCGVQQECMGAEDADCKNPNNDNRLLVIPQEDVTLCYMWEGCADCNTTDVREAFIDMPMTIAPNPFSNRTVVTFHTEIANAEVRLTNAMGQLVDTYRVNGPQLVIDRNGLTSGMYFLHVVTTEGVSAAHKLIVE